VSLRRLCCLLIIRAAQSVTSWLGRGNTFHDFVKNNLIGADVFCGHIILTISNSLINGNVGVLEELKLFHIGMIIIITIEIDVSKIRGN
jgi:hypothetical protein